MQVAEKLVRKQFLISQAQVKKIELLAKGKNTSAAEMVRSLSAQVPAGRPSGSPQTSLHYYPY